MTKEQINCLGAQWAELYIDPRIEHCRSIAATAFAAGYTQACRARETAIEHPTEGQRVLCQTPDGIELVTYVIAMATPVFVNGEGEWFVPDVPYWWPIPDVQTKAT